MGIYDREYYREDESPSLLSGRSMVVNIIILNVLIFFVDALFFSEQTAAGKVGAISSALSLKSNLLAAPWNCWQLITYGFVHDCGSLGHVLFNMLGLWFFGTSIEAVYGRKEFVRIYLTLVVMSGLAWVLINDVAVGSIRSDGDELIGASGGVVGIAVLYACHFPRRTINVWGVFPVMAWVLVSLYLISDLLSFFQLKSGNPTTAYSAHLAGAAFAFVYFRSGWNLGRLVPERLSLSSLKLKPKLRIHDPESDERELSRQVDRILEKIHRDGEASLTKKERKTLEEASRRYQRKRQ